LGKPPTFSEILKKAKENGLKEGQQGSFFKYYIRRRRS